MKAWAQNLDFLRMWNQPRLVVLTAVSAGVYAGTMIPLKGLVIFPGLAEVRPATVFPIVFSLLFGPAGAWGAAFGNLVADALGGMLGPGSIFGFLANFAYGYLPYKLWEAFLVEQDVGQELKNWRERVPPWLFQPTKIALLWLGIFGLGFLVLFLLHHLRVWDLSHLQWKLGAMTFTPFLLSALLTFSFLFSLAGLGLIYLFFSPRKLIGVIFIASLACASILGWGIELMGFFPFRVFGTWILINNFCISLLLVPPLIQLLYPRVEKMRLLYRDLRDEPRKSRRSPVAGTIVIVSLVVLFGLGFLAPAHFLGSFGSLSENLTKSLALSPLVAIFFISLLML